MPRSWLPVVQQALTDHPLALLSLPRFASVLLNFVSSIYASDRKLGTDTARLAVFPWSFDFHDKFLTGSQPPLYRAASMLLIELLEAELDDNRESMVV